MSGLPNLPVTVDFVVELNGGNFDVASALKRAPAHQPLEWQRHIRYQFREPRWPRAGPSHLLLAGRIVSTRQAPEPATLGLTGVGLIGLGFLRRRRAA